MMPGISQDMLGPEDDIQRRFRKMLCVMDSMTDQELDSDGKIFVSQPTRVLRVSMGAGILPEEFEMIFKWHRMMAGMVKQFGAMGLGKNPMAGLGGGGMPNSAQMARMQQQMRNPQFQQMAQRMGLGNVNLQQMMQQMQGGGMPDLSSLGNLMNAFGRGR